MKKSIIVILVFGALAGGANTAQAYGCSGLGSHSDVADLASCLKQLSGKIDDLESENADLKRQLRSLDTNKSRQSRDVEAAIERLERELDRQADKSFKLQCRRAYGSCAYGKVLLSQPGSDAGVCCSIVPSR